jgi:hypothetical protein
MDQRKLSVYFSITLQLYFQDIHWKYKNTLHYITHFTILSIKLGLGNQYGRITQL